MTRPLRTLQATADRPASAYQTEQLLREVIKRHEADLDRARREAARAMRSLELAWKALADLGVKV